MCRIAPRNKTGSAVKLEKDLELEIVGGPNDWDLWLNFRGTLREVSFVLSQAILIPPFTDSPGFIDGKIFSLWRAPTPGRFPDSWLVEGIGHKGDTSFTFKATYNTKTRKGTINILNLNLRGLNLVSPGIQV